METMNQKERTPEKPYDDSVWDNNSFYDNMPYVWDSDLNVEKIFTRATGNLIKCYRCKTKETFEVTHN